MNRTREIKKLPQNISHQEFLQFLFHIFQYIHEKILLSQVKWLTFFYIFSLYRPICVFYLYRIICVFILYIYHEMMCFKKSFFFRLKISISQKISLKFIHYFSFFHSFFHSFFFLRAINK